MHPSKLDHVALYVPDPREASAAILARLPFRVLEETDEFVLVGRGPDLGKLTLFRAAGPRRRGSLVRVGVGVPCALQSSRIELGDGLLIELVPGRPDGEVDVDHVALRVPDPDRSAKAWVDLGFEHAERCGSIERVRLGDALLELHPGSPERTQRPVLNHLGLLVESMDEARASARERGLDVLRTVEAENSRACFVAGPDGVEIELIEHRPSFAFA